MAILVSRNEENVRKGDSVNDVKEKRKAAMNKGKTAGWRTYVRKRFRCSRQILASLGILSLLIGPVWAQEQPADLTKVNIEDLMNIEVTSVSKKEQKLSRVAAAVFVITPEDIRRSGATNIPDLLRMVPGLQVAQINGSTWAITARGFDGQYSNKLLVLVDGRTVYSPIFSGTFWDSQTLLLDNIARIEVIRGPGATLWGANAVNGVINITTKKAADTQGGLLTTGGGTSEQGFATARYGGTIGGETSYRVSGGGFNFGHNLDSTGQDGEDDWRTFQGGFRVDA